MTWVERVLITAFVLISGVLIVVLVGLAVGLATGQIKSEEDAPPGWHKDCITTTTLVLVGKTITQMPHTTCQWVMTDDNPCRGK
jgi:hypothetical protein